MAHQLIETLVGDRASAVGRDVDAMVIAGHGSVDQHPEADRFSVGAGAKHEVEITRVEAIDDASGRAIARGLFLADRPLPPKAQSLSLGVGAS